MRAHRYRLLAALLLLAPTLAWNAAARADDDFIVYSPYVTAGQSEGEFHAHQQFDGDPALNDERIYVISLAHAFTGGWRPEISLGSFEREPGGPNQLQGYEFENTFQLADQGRFWADLGFIAAYESKTQPGVPGVVEFGPLFEKHNGRIMQRLNFIWEKELGGGASRKYEFRTSYAASYSVISGIAPGLEVYYRPADDSRQLGPAFYGEITSERGNEFEYSFAYLLGLNRGAPDRVLAVRLEYEFN